MNFFFPVSNQNTLQFWRLSVQCILYLHHVLTTYIQQLSTHREREGSLIIRSAPIIGALWFI